MRIGLFTDTYLPDVNGVVSSIVTLQQELEKNGHDVFVITTHPGLLQVQREGNVLRLPGVELKSLYGYVLTSPIHFAVLKDIREYGAGCDPCPYGIRCRDLRPDRSEDAADPAGVDVSYNL